MTRGRPAPDHDPGSRSPHRRVDDRTFLRQPNHALLKFRTRQVNTERRSGCVTSPRADAAETAFATALVGDGVIVQLRRRMGHQRLGLRAAPAGHRSVRWPSLGRSARPSTAASPPYSPTVHASPTARPHPAHNTFRGNTLWPLWSAAHHSLGGTPQRLRSPGSLVTTRACRSNARLATWPSTTSDSPVLAARAPTRRAARGSSGRSSTTPLSSSLDRRA